MPWARQSDRRQRSRRRGLVKSPGVGRRNFASQDTSRSLSKSDWYRKHFSNIVQIGTVRGLDILERTIRYSLDALFSAQDGHMKYIQVESRVLKESAQSVDVPLVDKLRLLHVARRVLQRDHEVWRGHKLHVSYGACGVTFQQHRPFYMYKGKASCCHCRYCENARCALAALRSNSRLIAMVRLGRAGGAADEEGEAPAGRTRPFTFHSKNSAGMEER